MFVGTIKKNMFLMNIGAIVFEECGKRHLIYLFEIFLYDGTGIIYCVLVLKKIHIFYFKIESK